MGLGEKRNYYQGKTCLRAPAADLYTFPCVQISGHNLAAGYTNLAPFLVL